MTNISTRSMPRHEQLIWTHPGMSTYYRNKQGRVFSAMPWRFVDYWRMTHDPDLSKYRQTKVRARQQPNQRP
jgi:4-hydroxyacetophenone monooxygenase